MTILPFHDETIESFMIRVSIAQKLPYRYIADHFSLPSKVESLNIFHAKNAQERFGIINSLEDTYQLPPKTLRRILVEKSSKIWGINYTSYQYDLFNIPAVLYRKQYIPVCPLCLKEKSYIRIAWHFQTSFVCSKHSAELIFHCPNCLSHISYMANESIDRCRCSANIMNISPTIKQTEIKYNASNKSILGAFLFFKIFKRIPIHQELNNNQHKEFEYFHRKIDIIIQDWFTKQFISRKQFLTKRIDNMLSTKSGGTLLPMHKTFQT